MATSKKPKKSTKKVSKASEPVKVIETPAPKSEPVSAPAPVWNSLQEFRASVNASGINPNAINVEAERNLYSENPKAYKNPMNLK